VDLPSTEPEPLELPLFEPTPQEMVKEFMTAFEANPDRELVKRLVTEEANEVHEALSHLLKELTDLSYVVTQGHVLGHEDVTDEEIPEIGGLAHVYGAFPFEVRLEAFKRVHRSNMSKLDGGKPLRREDGKILKGPHYREPYLLDLV
jgi:predicted HAD superfamily Cof-like phosphohydrolase